MSKIYMVKIIFVLTVIEYFILSVHNQGQSSKTITKNMNKSMHSLIDNCCETHFHLLCIVLRSFIRLTLLYFFYFSIALRI